MLYENSTDSKRKEEKIHILRVRVVCDVIENWTNFGTRMCGVVYYINAIDGRSIAWKQFIVAERV